MKMIKIKSKSLSDKNLIRILSPFMALIAPFLVWPIEQMIPVPYLVEELVKAVLIFTILDLPEKAKQIQLALLFGLLFSFSEAVLYSFNFYLLSFNFIVVRLLFTTALHVTTMVVMMSLSIINKKLLVVGIMLAVFIHYLYNLLVTF